MAIKKELITKAHEKGMYIDRTTGVEYPAIPREEFYQGLKEIKPTAQTPLYYCKATICYCDYSPLFKDYPIMLVSYETPVAYYIKHTGILYVLDYYSVTTCQHISKFEKCLKRYYAVKRINCYNRIRDKKGSHIEYEPFIPFL